MGLEINLFSKAQPQDIWIADRKLWLTADRSEAVEDGDAKAAFLLCAPGQSLPCAQVEALGVIPKPKAEAMASEEKAPPEGEEDEKPAEEKEKPKPADKAKAKPNDKSRKKAKRK